MAWDRHGVLERCAMSAATAWGFYLMARFVNHRWHMTALESQLAEAQAALEHERTKRKADRVGRIRAEQELRTAKVQLQQLQLQAQLQPGAAGAEAAGAAEAVAGGGAERREGAGAEAEAEAEDADGGDAVAGAAAGGSSSAGAGGGGSGSSTTTGRLLDDRKRAAAAAALAAAGAAMPAFPFRPIGHLQSVFSERNGTPRQPQLVPAARSRLVLSPSVPAACLEGITQYSHVWVLYVFHANTDLAKYLSPDRSGLKAKIHVPRLNGGRMGVLATRSPHRPSPIGLSTAAVIGVENNCLILGGADIVDGSPVLDIKPYVPFCDCLTAATAPAWVQAEADDEPLAVGEVVVGPAARAALTSAWSARRALYGRGQGPMYGSAEAYLQLVQQVLSRDIRSVNQRLNVKPINPTAAAGAAGAGASAPAPARNQDPAGPDSDPDPRPGQYHVVLENIYISYDIDPASGAVEVRDAWVDPITAGLVKG
ncbi:hypothetical protein HXX76_015614 [Chlamydomonas incerta]|uniref:TsaA-like domain-containing protein n=1 Tax=Chlamydomonas incerta TaxID=51695 RepID=A0A835SCG9_CHLIN|nr:hypothetical protein HXX76_015614 [Chlamydomonas incerta]|eukprot:KAG2423016.1 hypothetical protein HXX76_015614 [Chlamydomonas incerta]